MQKKVRALARRAGPDTAKASPHKFRHAFATELVNREVSLDAIKDLLGHSSLSTTQMYLHTSHARLREAVTAIEGKKGHR